MKSRATVSDCVALLTLNGDSRRDEAQRLDAQEQRSRDESYTYHTCSTSKCGKKVRVYRAPENRPDLCTDCWISWITSQQARVQ